MKKKCKRVLLPVVLALLIAALAGLFAACSRDNNPVDNAVAYSVKVMIDAQTPASGVNVQLAKGSAKFDTKATDASGKAEFMLAPDSYEVKLSKLPAHYEVPSDASLKLDAQNRDLTVTLKKSFVYTVKLVKTDGTPYYADGVSVMMCTVADESNCLAPVALEKDGTAIIDAQPGAYHVKVNDLPITSIIEVDDKGYYSGKNFSAADTEMSITVTTATEVTSGTELTAEQKQEVLYGDQVYRTAYKLSATLKPNEIAYYALTAQMTGVYNITTDYKANYLSNGTTFTLGAEGNPIYVISATKGNTYFFKAVNDTEEDVTTEVIVTVPRSTYVSLNGKGANAEGTIGAQNTNAVFAFSPTEAGKYKFSVDCASPTAISATATQADETIVQPLADSAYSTNPEANHTVYTSELSSTVYIAVTAKAAQYPVDFTLKIEKTAAIVDNITVATVQATNLSNYDKPADKELYGVPMDGTAQVVLGGDGYYHYGENGPVIVVNITGKLDQSRFLEKGQLAYLEMIDDRLATYKVITKNENGETTVDYSLFLRGFDTYDETPGQHGNVLTIPETKQVEKYYAKYVNADGVYPMNQELYDFLHVFYNANKDSFDWQVPMDADLDSAWLFPCFYYDTYVPADVIVGEYSFVKHVDSSGNEETPETANYTLTVRKDNTYTIEAVSKRGTMEVESGTWSKEDEVYTFVFPQGAYNPKLDQYVDLEYTVTFDSTAGTLKLEGPNGSSWEFTRAQN